MQGKVALVTGGASGIGEAVAELLAREGATVVVTDIDELRGPEVVTRITKAGGKAVFLEQDVTSEERWVEIVAEIERSAIGRLDILVSNAGIGIAVPSIVDMSLADWRKQTAINLDGVFLSVKHCLPLMRKTGGGSIIMMSSLAGLRGAAGLAGYSRHQGRRAAVRQGDRDGMRRCRRRHPRQFGASRHHRHPDLGQDPDRSAGTGQNAPIDPEERAKLATPLGHAGQAQDIANGVLYLASDASRYMTGPNSSSTAACMRAACRGRREAARHCERSEAVHPSVTPRHGLLPPSLFELRRTSRFARTCRQNLRSRTFQHCSTGRRLPIPAMIFPKRSWKTRPLPTQSSIASLAWSVTQRE